MSLTSGEQRWLAEIERHLCRSDPGLARKFDRFTARGPRKRRRLAHLPRYRQGPARRARVTILLLVSMTLVFAALAAGAVAMSHAAPRGWPGLVTHRASIYSPLG